MRRRIQGFSRQGTQNKAKNYDKVDQDYGIETRNNEPCTFEDQLNTDSATGFVNTKAEDQSGLAVNRQDTEISAELISEVIEQYQQQLLQQQQQLLQQQQLFQQQQQQQYQRQQAQAKEQQKSGQKDQSERNKLQTLIAKLLLGKNNDAVSQTTSYDLGTTNPILAANDRSLQQNSQQSNQQQGQQQGSQQQGQEIQTNLTGKIATQVLSEAQYELSTELEVSLNKLRAVIDESKQIAQKISSALEQNDGGNGSSNKSDNQ